MKVHHKDRPTIMLVKLLLTSPRFTEINGRDKVIIYLYPQCACSPVLMFICLKTIFKGRENCVSSCIRKEQY